MRRDLPMGTVTLLFTDIEGSTRLLHELGPEVYAEELARHRKRLRAAFTEHDGVEVDTQGDAFFVAFPTATGAADAATAGQHALADGPVRVRIGLHTGVPTATVEGYVGVDVHRGARVAALAHGGQVLVSPATAALLDGAALVDLGSHRLKDFEGATRVFQLGLGDFPPLRTPGSIELPTPATPFLGREQELFDAVELVLERDPAVLTVVGAGGTGKTRFAIELARLLGEEADGGTVFVPLAPLRDVELLVPAVSQRLGAADETAGSIAISLHGRRAHVVLDNAEHLLPDAAGGVAELLRDAPTLRLIVTSRESLRIQGEHEFDLPPLVEDEAVALFLARAAAVRPGLARTPAVDELCRRLDLLPLAVELAAARSKLLAPEALLERLGDRLDLLRGSRDADPRHATLRATIAWSYDLLSAEEQRGFAHFSVFAAGATLESAEAVCDADVEELESLLDKSLLRRRVGALGEDRFWMLETIREFAGNRLDESVEADDVRRRHAERMYEIAASAHLSPETGAFGTEPQRHELVLAERDDIRAALDWAVDHDVELGLTLAVALENFWATHAAHEGAERIASLLEQAPSILPELRASALRVHGSASYRAGDYEVGKRRYEESLAAYRELDDVRGEAVLITRLAVHAANVKDIPRTRRLAQQSIELARELEIPWLEAQALSALASAAFADEDRAQAFQLTERSATLSGECGFRWWEAGQLLRLLELGVELGRLDEAERAGKDGLRLSHAMEDDVHVVWGLTGFALLARERGRLEAAGYLWGAVDAERERAVPESWMPNLLELAGQLLTESGGGFRSGYERGRAEGLDAAVAFVLGEDQTLP